MFKCFNCGAYNNPYRNIELNDEINPSLDFCSWACLLTYIRNKCKDNPSKRIHVDTRRGDLFYTSWSSLDAYIEGLDEDTEGMYPDRIEKQRKRK
jgi:hypothetical protein